MLHAKHKPLDEKGFASIVIALILIIVLALLTIGFAQLARREQQNALGKQLATQAYDAAESGINDVRSVLPAIASASPQPAPDQCLSSIQLTSFGLNPDIKSSQGASNRGVSYSCVMVNLNPTSLVKDPLGANAGWTTAYTLSGVPSKLTIKWTSKDGKAGPYPSSGFTPLSGWVSPNVLQFSLTPLTSMSRATLISNTFTAYLYPSSSGGSMNYTAGSQGSIAPAACSGTTCSIDLTGLGGFSASTQYLMRIVAAPYDDSAITVTAKAGSADLEFSGAQTIVDVTGRARNVLKRLRVRVPTTNQAALPNYGLEGQDICKRFMTDPVSGTQPAAPSGYTGTACNLN